ncbi:MAG: cell division protein FtsQ/DivIB, partial [Bryobacteraceae bacterium]|nr:cell division protein FtsQ/DivIB [Bryobacteraceae bacterium]
MIIETTEPRAESRAEPRAERAPKSESSRREKNSSPARPPRLWRYWVTGIFTALAAIALFLAWRQIDHYLTREPRFALAPPTEPGGESPGLRIDGLKNSPRDRVLRIFEQDHGRSIYRFPMAERRRELLAIDWIKDATIVRLWPNQIHIVLEERKPVAFARLAHRVQLIDADGVLLEPHSQSKFTLPVINGLSVDTTETQRQLVVARVLKLVREAGPAAGELSEIDASDAENLKVTQKIDDRAVVLLLGREHFRERLENFYGHINEIRERYPNARVLDLRLEDRITAAGAAAAAPTTNRQEDRADGR